MGKALLALLVAAAVLMIPAWQSGVLSEPVEVCTIDKRTSEERCAVHGAVFGTLLRAGTFLERHGEGAVSAFAIVLAISTTLLWFATHRLQKSVAVLQEAAERQIAVARQSADAATKAAAAAEASVKAMMDTAQRQLQVYGSVQAALIELLEPQRDSSSSNTEQERRPDTGI